MIQGALNSEFLKFLIQIIFFNVICHTLCHTPKKGAEMLAVRLPENLEHELIHYAKILHKTKTDVVKEALVLYFSVQERQDQKAPYELGETFFGRYESNGDDLSATCKQKLKRKIGEK